MLDKTNSVPQQNICFEFSEKILNQFYIILVNPKLPANIGSAARAMLNMGLHNLIVIGKKELLTEDAYSLAKNGATVLDRAEFSEDLKEAIAGMNYIIGTTRRPTRYYYDILTPPNIIPSLIEMAQNNKIAIIFGPEDTGLHISHLSFCNKLLRIPTASECPSLNLGQAVLLVCYELFRGISSHTSIEQKVEQKPDVRVVEGLFEHLEEFLYQINYLPHESPRHTIQLFRQILRACNLSDYDIGLLRSLLHKTQYFIEHKTGKSSE